MKATKTALFEAAKRWEAAAVRTIATTLPSLVAATDPKGRTALHIACAVDPKGKVLGERDGTRTVAALLAAGADPSIKDPQGRDAVDIARARRLPKAIIARLAELKSRS